MGFRQLEAFLGFGAQEEKKEGPVWKVHRRSIGFVGPSLARHLFEQVLVFRLVLGRFLGQVLAEILCCHHRGWENSHRAEVSASKKSLWCSIVLEGSRVLKTKFGPNLNCFCIVMIFDVFFCACVCDLF